MIIGVSFDGKHCLDHYGMYLTNVEIEQPEVQSHYIQVPGRNGALDFTEALSGDVKYYNGTITMTFQTAHDICNRSWLEQLALVSGDLHGRVTDLVFDDSDTTYHGRCEVEGTPTAGGIYEIQIAVNVEP